MPCKVGSVVYSHRVCSAQVIRCCGRSRLGCTSALFSHLAVTPGGAGSSVVWLSGGRACGAGFALQFVIGPLGEWISMLMGHPVKFPQMDLGTMMPLLFGMLGLGAYRTAEKIQGVAR